MAYKFWGISNKIKEQIESRLPHVTQHIGSVGTYLPTNHQCENDRYDQIAEEIVRCAYINTDKEHFSGQIRLKSYSDETNHRLHHNGFFGLEILIRVSCPTFLDTRLPCDSIVLSLNHENIATAELCMGRYGQIYALFFREPIPISTNIGSITEGTLADDMYQWTLTINNPHQEFIYDDMEVYWIFGEHQNIPLPHNSTIRVFQYGNTHWFKHPPFQHRGDAYDDGLYTNELALDVNGNVVCQRYTY